MAQTLPSSNSLVYLANTKQFSVYELANPEGPNRCLRQLPSYLLEGPFNKSFCNKFNKQMKYHGMSILRNLVHNDDFQVVKSLVKKFAANLISHYNYDYDEFSDYDQEKNLICRMPCIGKGKHNIHFDPEFHPIHQALLTLITNAGILDLLSQYTHLTCSLRETGLTVTRPRKDKDIPSEFTLENCGEGMEWHSDGAKGEFTMLLAVEDVTADMGAVRIVPRSHLQYVDGVGHEESVLAKEADNLENNLLQYCYRAGTPMLFDARTLHSVNNNTSSTWRVVIWFIIDCY